MLKSSIRRGSLLESLRNRGVWLRDGCRPPDLPSHIHLTCLRCGTIQELISSFYEELTAEIASARGFQVEVSRFEVGGICRRCAATQGRERSGRNDTR
jgi:Fe2+ or Zn2+ uptake regulation protein